jgi:hypothetical protein
MTKSDIRSMSRRDVLLEIRRQTQSMLDRIEEGLTVAHFWNANNPDKKPLTADDDDSIATLVERKRQAIEYLADLDREISELPDLGVVG